MVAPRLEHDSDPRSPPIVAMCRVDAQHQGPSRRPHPEALQNLDRRGLTGPVRPKQRQDLSRARLQRHTEQRISRAVAHA
jgi:hypothetical protein